MKLNSISIADLQKELARRARGAEKLNAKRETLLARVAEVDAELKILGIVPATPVGKLSRGVTPSRAPSAATSSTGRTRPKNEMSLPEAIVAAMDVSAVISPKEAAELVLANGHKTSSKTFAVQVAQVLTKDTRFKRIGRGQYERVK